MAAGKQSTKGSVESRVRKLVLRLMDEPATARAYLTPKGFARILKEHGLVVSDLPTKGLPPKMLMPWPPEWAPAIVVATCTPGRIRAGTTVDVEITGSGFDASHDVRLLKRNQHFALGLRAESVQFVDSTELVATIEVDEVEAYDVYVGNAEDRVYGVLNSGIVVK